MPSNTTVPARSTIIAQLNLVSGDTTRIQVGQIGTSAVVESAGPVIAGISTGRALSDVYDSGELGNPRRDHTSRENADRCRELSKHTIATVSSMLHSDVLKGGEDLKAPRRQYACCVMPVGNMNEEPVTIQAGTAMATASPWENSEEDERRIRPVGTEKRGHVITPVIERIWERNSKVPELSRQKLQHLSAEERDVIEPVILEDQ
jgi:hypothetical protein